MRFIGLALLPVALISTTPTGPTPPKTETKTTNVSFAPSPSSLQLTLQTQFDSVNVPLPGGLVAPPVGLDGLQFGSQVVRNDIPVDLVPGIVRSRSKPNSLGAAALQEVTGAPRGNISVVYPDSKFKSFTPIRLFLGCSILLTVPRTTPLPLPVDPNQAPRPSVPVAQGCTVSFSGKNGKGKDVKKVFTYTGTVLNPALQEVKFDDADYSEVKTLEIKVESGLVAGETVVYGYDDFTHVNFFK